MDVIYNDILARLEKVLSGHEKPVLLHAPFMNGNEEKYVTQTIRENWVSSAGAFVSEFEKKLAAYCGVKFAVAVVNGTAAIHASLYALGIGQGDEVLVPSATFVASGNAIIHAGATTHFIDCEDKTFGVDAEKLASYLKQIVVKNNAGFAINKNTGNPIKAMLAVHIFGVPADIDTLQKLCDEFGIILMQDATECLGASYKAGNLFSYGSCAVLSFNGNKIITSGGGGAVLTDDENLAKRIKHLTTTAKKPHAFAFMHDEVGYNYRMPNINAALAFAQLEQMDDFLRRKKILASDYEAAFKDFTGGVFMQTDDKRQSNYWLNTLLLDKADVKNLYEGIGFLNEQGYHARPLWTPLHQLPMYKASPRMDDLSITEDVAGRIINLPSSAFLRR